MKHFVQTGPSRTLKCSNEKFVADFAQWIGVVRQPWQSQQSKSFYENLREQLVTQYQDIPRGLECMFTSHSTMAISWLAEFLTRMEPGYLATRRVSERLIQLEQTSGRANIGLYDEETPRDKLRAQLAVKIDQIESRLQSVNLMEHARVHYEHIFTRWNHGDYFSFSPAGRCYAVLQELYWGEFGEAISLCDNAQKAHLIEEVRARVIDQLASDVSASPNTRHYYHEWLTAPFSPGVLKYKEALVWLGDACHIDQQPVSYSVTQTWRGISLGMPRICSAMRLGGALVDELLVQT